MSNTQRITESVVSNISKGPLVIFILFGLGLWQASNMTESQIVTIEKLVSVLNNPVGAAIYFASLIFITYAVILYPPGKFLGRIAQEFLEMQKTHNAQHNDHVEASKKMYHQLNEILERCDGMAKRIDKFYGRDEN